MDDSPVLDFLSRRRSVSALNLQPPGPDAAQLARLLAIAARVPDHGKLAPWRFVVIEGDARAALLARLEAIALAGAEPAKATAALRKFARPPLCVAVISHVRAAAIPEWEQLLSAGAACMNLLTAALAMGFGANWLTDWYAYDPQATALLGLAEGERVAGMVMIGTATSPPDERPRPDPAELITHLDL